MRFRVYGLFPVGGEINPGSLEMRRLFSATIGRPVYEVKSDGFAFFRILTSFEAGQRYYSIPHIRLEYTSEEAHRYAP